jgi:hypothetical protein
MPMPSSGLWHRARVTSKFKNRPRNALCHIEDGEDKTTHVVAFSELPAVADGDERVQD